MTAIKQPFVTVVDNNYNEADFILRYKVIPPAPKVYDKNGKKKSTTNSVKTISHASSKGSKKKAGASCPDQSNVQDSEQNDIQDSQQNSTQDSQQNSTQDSHKSSKSKRSKSPRKKSNSQSPDDIYYRLNGIDDFLRF